MKSIANVGKGWGHVLAFDGGESVWVAGLVDGGDISLRTIAADGSLGALVDLGSEDYIGYPGLASQNGKALLAFTAYPSGGADEIRCVAFDTAAGSPDVVKTLVEGAAPAIAANHDAKNFGIAYSEEYEYPRMMVYPASSSSKKGCAATASGSPALFIMLAAFAASVLLLRRSAAC